MSNEMCLLLGCLVSISLVLLFAKARGRHVPFPRAQRITPPARGPPQLWCALHLCIQPSERPGSLQLLRCEDKCELVFAELTIARARRNRGHIGNVPWECVSWSLDSSPGPSIQRGGFVAVFSPITWLRRGLLAPRFLYKGPSWHLDTAIFQLVFLGPMVVNSNLLLAESAGPAPCTLRDAVAWSVEADGRLGSHVLAQSVGQDARRLRPPFAAAQLGNSVVGPRMTGQPVFLTVQYRWFPDEGLRVTVCCGSGPSEEMWEWTHPNVSRCPVIDTVSFGSPNGLGIGKVCVSVGRFGPGQLWSLHGSLWARWQREATA